MKAETTSSSATAESPDVVFWNWFAREEERLAKGVHSLALKNVVEEIEEQLAALKALVSEVEIAPTEHAPHTLVVTATSEWHDDLFSIVVQLVAKAPKLKRWKVVVECPGCAGRWSSLRCRREFENA